MAKSETWPVEELTGRWARIQSAMAGAGLDGVMLGEASNFLYVSGHESTQFLHRMRPQIFLLPRTGKPTFFIYAAEAAKLKRLDAVANFKSYVDVPFPVDDLAKTMAGMGWEKATIGAELGANQRLGLPVLDYLALQKAMPSAQWADAGPAVMAVQSIKSAEEVRVLRKACEISRAAWELLLTRVHPGVTADQINLQLAIANIECGADASQPYSAHITQLSLAAKDGVFRAGDMLKCDFHTRYRGYWSDLCRLATIGEPTAQHRAWHERQFKLLSDCLNLVRPGAKVSDVAAFSNTELVAMGKKPLSPIKRIGHGVGLEATTPPSLNMLDETVFMPGMTVAVEPRIEVEIGGLLLEETVVVTETGHQRLSTGAENLGVII